MILRALFELAEREHLVEDPDFVIAPVAWLVRVSAEGTILGIEDTRREEAKGRRKPRLIARPYTIPRQPGRTSGDRAFFLCDKSEYSLGLVPAGTSGSVPEKLARRFMLFREQIAACAAATADEGVTAVRIALDDLAAGRQTVALSPECAPNDLLAFVYSPDTDVLVHERPAVREYWKSLRREEPVDATQRPLRCVVTGTAIRNVGNFPKVKKVPGGQSSGVPLVSFNASAFESFGLSGNENAPISREAGEACATALQRLLDPAFPVPGRPGEALPRRNIRLNEDTVVCYWAAKPVADPFLDCLGPLLEAIDPSQVGEAYRGVWSGRATKLRDPTAFYALTLSGAQGRMIIRDWFESTITETQANLAQHFADLRVARVTPPPKGRESLPHLPMSALLQALAPTGRGTDVPPAIGSAFAHAALRGGPYPLSILQRAIERTRAEIGQAGRAASALEFLRAMERRDARASLIKAVLERRRRAGTATTDIPELTVSLDPTSTAPGYLLGRLMAVIERLQQAALRDVNASVVDRYFAAASASPRAAFTRLLKNARHHARKAKDDPSNAGLAIWLERQMDDIASHFDPQRNGFPSWLDLEQQGLFVLGYHQQRHWLHLSREERERLETT